MKNNFAKYITHKQPVDIIQGRLPVDIVKKFNRACERLDITKVSGLKAAIQNFVDWAESQQAKKKAG